MKPRRKYSKRDFPVTDVRRFLEPGPVVLVSSAYGGQHNIMTMGWHMVLLEDPSLIGCFIWDQDRSRNMILRSKECVINVPTYSLLDAVIGIGNTHGPRPDKFKRFRLTPLPAEQVAAPLIAECFANFECKLVDSSLVRRYSLIVLEVVKAHVAVSKRFPRTVHYRGSGIFMVSGQNVDRRRLFKKSRL